MAGHLNSQGLFLAVCVKILMSCVLKLSQIRVLDNLDEELVDTASQLEGKTGAQIVGKMGRTFLLYRPSVRKLIAAQGAEEKAYKYQKRKSVLASRSVKLCFCSFQSLNDEPK